jgi:hypothetical protein
MTKRKALLTGATGGLGQALAARLASEGYALVLVDFDPARLAAMAARYSGAVSQVLDQRDMAAVARFSDEVIEQGDSFDVAIVNAGMLTIGTLAGIERQAVLDQLQVNLVSGALLIQSLARRMLRERKGHILATVSMGGIVALKGSATYSASKFGLRGLLWALRDELAESGVRVSGIYPAGIDTPMLRHEARHGGSALNFVGTPVTVDDVVNATMAAIRRPRLEVYVPKSEGVTSRIVGAWPGLLLRLYPMLERIGEKGRQKFLQRLQDE